MTEAIRYKLMLAEPTPEMLKAFQNGFMSQLGNRRNSHGRVKHPMSAEEAGLRAMLKHVPLATDRLPQPRLQQLEAIERAARVIFARYEEFRGDGTAPELEALRKAFALDGAGAQEPKEESASGRALLLNLARRLRWARQHVSRARKERWEACVADEAQGAMLEAHNSFQAAKQIVYGMAPADAEVSKKKGFTP